MRARLRADKIAARRNRAASPRDYVNDYVPGGRSEEFTRLRRGSQPSYCGGFSDSPALIWSRNVCRNAWETIVL